jgi:hypothetical protein
MIILFSNTFLCAQTPLDSFLQTIPGITVEHIASQDFRETYLLGIPQLTDHSNPNSAVFMQKAIIGFNDKCFPVVLQCEGYKLYNASVPEVPGTANVIAVEHRFYGSSRPPGQEFSYLTMQQAAEDLHYIHELFSPFFKQNWISVGASKGGQAALSYRMFYPEDVKATLVYSTPVKQSQNDLRMGKRVDSLDQTICNGRARNFQIAAFKNLEELNLMLWHSGGEARYSLSPQLMSNIVSSMILDYPFTIFQTCKQCEEIPDSSAGAEKILEELLRVEPFQYFNPYSDDNLRSTLYMQQHELGTYVYDSLPFRKWLSNKSVAQVDVLTDPSFDPRYQQKLQQFLSSSAENILFIYGELDPYAAAKPIQLNRKCVMLEAKYTCHKARISNLDSSSQQYAKAILNDWMEIK